MVTEKKTDGPVSRLRSEAGGLLGAVADRATSSLGDKVNGATERLGDYVAGDHKGHGLIGAVTGAKDRPDGKGPVSSMMGDGMKGAKEKVSGIFGGRKGKSGGRQKLKVTTIVESIDVGAPVRVAYNQWTQFREFPTYTKKVENVDQVEDEKLNWKAQIFWSHREWEATILEQHPDERIIWRSKGQKGHVDGAVTFHELTPNLTKVLVVMEYHPQGLFEHTGNLWRAQGRRARLELKHFERQVMSHTMLNPDDVEGWRGVIEDGQVVKDHETAMKEEGRERGESGDGKEGRERGESGDGERDESGDGAKAPSRRRAGAASNRTGGERSNSKTRGERANGKASGARASGGTRGERGKGRRESQPEPT